MSPLRHGMPVLVVALLATSLGACAARPVRPSSAPSGSGSARRPQIDAQMAAVIGEGLLRAKGVKDVVVCRTQVIMAPVGGYMVDALGTLQRDGRRYSLFRIGVYDGSDGPQYPTGREFVFIARGTDAAGGTAWLPPPGPDPMDADPNGTFISEYEFLYDRAEFEQVPSRCHNKASPR
jgi:hypothetical protein